MKPKMSQEKLLFQKEVGAKLKNLRQILGLSKKKVEEATNVTRERQSVIESGSHLCNIQLYEIMLLAKFHKISLDALCYDELFNEVIAKLTTENDFEDDFENIFYDEVE